MFFDVGLYRQEILMNEIGGLGVLIRFGIQPNTTPSGRRSAEIEQDRTVVLPGFGECLIDIFTPVHGHRILRGANRHKKL